MHIVMLSDHESLGGAGIAACDHGFVPPMRP